MHFRFDKRYSHLLVDDNFAYLNNISENGDLEFLFFYGVDPKDAMSHDAMSVSISVLSRTIKQKPLFENSQVGNLDTKALVSNILKQMPDAKSALKQREEYVVASRNSDITSKINNEIIGQLQSKLPSKNIQQLYRPVLKLLPSSKVKQSSEVKPLLSIIAHEFTTDVKTVFSSSVNENPTMLMHDMITRQSVDPSDITQLTKRDISSVDAISGVVRRSTATEVRTSPITRLLNYHLFPPEVHDRPKYTTDVEDSTLVQVLVNEPITQVELATRVVIPKNSLKLDGKNITQFFVKFELKNGKTGVSIDTVERLLDTSKHVNLYYTPIKAPIVKVAKSELASKVNLEIIQVDVGATAVQLYKKVINKSLSEIDDYVLFGTYDVSVTDKSLLVQVDMPTESTNIYRVVPVGKFGTQGFEFTNIVVNPARYKNLKSISLTTKPTDTGIAIEVRQIPQRVVAIQYMVKNLTFHETSYSNVDLAPTLISDVIRESDFTFVIDKNVQSGNSYQYAVKLLYVTGTTEIVSCIPIEFKQQTPGKVDTKIENVTVDQFNADKDFNGIIDIDVKFNMSTTVVDSDIDVVKKMLQNQDMYELFFDDVKKEREYLKSLIAHNVQRVNLTTGEREDFGVITDTQFSDTALRKNQAIQPLRPKNRYRYEIVALLRPPETMLENYVKTATDSVTKKTYKFKPSKYLHPITLERGIIVSSAGLKLKYAKDSMMYGAIGSMKTVDVFLDVEPVKIIDASCSRFSKYLNVISWKLEGDVNQVDHFIIMKDVLGVRTVVGKVHSEFANNNCQYLHPLSKQDEGSFSYVIVPIFNDYKVGQQVTTNLVIVEKDMSGTV